MLVFHDSVGKVGKIVEEKDSSKGGSNDAPLQPLAIGGHRNLAFSIQEASFCLQDMEKI
jgi:hypothetical protein